MFDSFPWGDGASTAPLRRRRNPNDGATQSDPDERHARHYGYCAIPAAHRLLASDFVCRTTGRCPEGRGFRRRLGRGRTRSNRWGLPVCSPGSSSHSPRRGIATLVAVALGDGAHETDARSHVAPEARTVPIAESSGVLAPKCRPTVVTRSLPV